MPTNVAKPSVASAAGADLSVSPSVHLSVPSSRPLSSFPFPPSPALAPLAIVGNLNVDQWVGPVDRLPSWDEELVVDSARIELAGTAGYLLRACRGLGWDAYAVSTVGDDVFGKVVLAEMAELGLDSSGVEVVPGAETCLGIIFVGPDGRRSILGTLGAHALMDPAMAQRHDARVAACPEVLLCGTYLLPRFGPAAALPYARRLRSRGQTVVFDPSWDPSGWGEPTRRDTLALLAEVDVYLPNDQELTRLTGEPDWQAALDIVAGVVGEIVLKRGPLGAVYRRGDEQVAAPGLVVNAVNTIGAGDTFDAGYLYARRLGHSPLGRLRFANALAAMVVSQPGRRAYPDAAAVEAVIGGAP